MYSCVCKDTVDKIRNLRISQIYALSLMHPLTLLPRNVNKDATSINDFTNKILAKRRHKVLFWVLFHTTILLYLHVCS